MLHRLSTRTLALIAGYGGVGVLGTGLYLKWKIEDNWKNEPFVRESVKILRLNKYAANVLGCPIQSGKIDIGSPDNSRTDTAAYVKLPVKGPNAKAYLFISAAKENQVGKWEVHRLELELKKDKTKRLVIYKKKLIVKI
nr:U11/U12 small nuclear ribonucleoprotein 25 kDa protein [Chrysogorgia stellata]